MKTFFPTLMFLAVFSASVSCLHGVLPPGTGNFSYHNARDGRTVRVFYVKSQGYRPDNPPTVVIHGMNRTPDKYRDGWIQLAEKHNLFVVAPLFSREEYPGSRSYNLGNLFKSEKDLTPNPESTWSFHVPGEVFDQLLAMGETTADGYFAFGHSAGSQFLHRKMALVPDPRILMAVAANAGWYTFPDPEVDWPYGWSRTRLTAADLAPYLVTNMVILLGDADIDTEDDSLRRTPEALKQGPHRYARGQAFYAAGKALAETHKLPFNWKLQVVPGIGHDQAGMAVPAARLMEACLDKSSEPD